VQFLLISIVIEQAGLARQDKRVAIGRFDSGKSLAIPMLLAINMLQIGGLGKNLAKPVKNVLWLKELHAVESGALLLKSR
jgi:hypothetical protein